MQKLVVATALCTLLLQVVLVSLHRESTTWTFALVQRTERGADWEKMDKLFVQRAPNDTLPPDALQGLQPSLQSCVQDAWRTYRPHVPVQCLLRGHNGFEIQGIMAAFNPHLLLLALCSVHAVFCVRRAFPDHVQRLCAFAAALGALNVGLGLLHTTYTGSDGFHYPTVTSILLCFAACFYYLYTAPESAKEDPYWEVVMELQVVGAPLVALVFAAMGVRIAEDALYHLVSLVVACNSLWLQRVAAKRPLTKFLCALVVLGLPTSSLLLMRHELQADQNAELWHPMVAQMAFVAMVPLYVLSLSRSNTLKFPLHLTQLCLGAALLVTIFNLAMF